MDNRGQISFEYLMIFAISIIILIVFTLPLTQTAVEDTVDVSDSMDAKHVLSDVSKAIKEVYGEGQGSKRQVAVEISQPMKINIGKSYLSCTLSLKDNTRKSFKQHYQSSLDETSITLRKGKNILVIEWPIGSENMAIYNK